ncbi:TetR/AcrR family transcriptional regulator [Blastococcus goldschmidtiae]|uniref:TetR/AcrR family transcriptional regulator n=1 Tax=Blastococcus goldschmidtiae TaxID=3075546 RepID=A0ABU2K6Y4_9ACTN|nr:TetR/AcrR family transcriptional regulator [Blastococcus sp. DSM 46792]MDT0275928.1 TetR/AcrR family transcriptional regulator [Blastococcus sp. DSM 46792]
MTARRDTEMLGGGTVGSELPFLDEETALPDGPSEPVRRLLQAGLEVFAERGFHAATTREIAARAGMSPAALYIHFRAKTDVLFELSHLGHTEVLRQLREVAAENLEPVQRIRHLVEAFTTFHVRNHRMARVAQYEHRALSGEQYESIIKLRRDIDSVFRHAVVDGMRARAFDVDDISGVLTAIASLCIDVVRWRDTGPKWPAERLARLNGRLVLSMLRAGEVPGDGGTEYLVGTALEAGLAAPEARET